jgi:hypothetical protein
MKVDFNRKFKDYKGNETAGIIADELAKSLFSVGMKENSFTNDEKYNAYLLCNKINQNSGIIEITIEEAALIKKVSAESFIAGGYGQVCELIENKTETKIKGGK